MQQGSSSSIFQRNIMTVTEKGKYISQEFNIGKTQTIADALHLQNEKNPDSGRTDTEHQPSTPDLSLFFRVR